MDARLAGVGHKARKSSFTAAIPPGVVTGCKSAANFSFGASKRDMQSVIMQKPVSIAVEAGQYAFHAYKSGVLPSGCGTSLDHSVLAVSYSQSATPYPRHLQQQGTMQVR